MDLQIRGLSVAAVVFSLPARVEARTAKTARSITAYYQLNPFSTLAILDRQNEGPAPACHFQDPAAG